jgi:hypothetical protein
LTCACGRFGTPWGRPFAQPLLWRRAPWLQKAPSHVHGAVHELSGFWVCVARPVLPQLSSNIGSTPRFQLTCGVQAGYWTGDTVCGADQSFGSPFDCSQPVKVTHRGCWVACRAAVKRGVIGFAHVRCAVLF